MQDSSQGDVGFVEREKLNAKDLVKGDVEEHCIFVKRCRSSMSATPIVAINDFSTGGWSSAYQQSQSGHRCVVIGSCTSDICTS